jgi:hypothetical protein
MAPQGSGEPLPLSMYNPAAPPQPSCADPKAPPSLDAANLKSAFDPEEPCEQPHYLITADYLHWWIHKPMPPLITTGAGTGATGIVGQPGTEVVFGANKDSQEAEGGRFSFGYWFDNSPFAVEAGILFLGDRATHLETGSDANGNPVLARPIINALTNQETVLFISAPGQFSGQVQASSRSSLFGADANVIMDISPSGMWKLPNLVVGFKYLNLQEDLNIDQQSTALTAGVVGFEGGFLGAGTVVSLADTFTTRNQFIGGQVGARAEYERGYFFMNLSGTVGLGSTHQAVSINGLTNINGATATAPPTPLNVNLPGGLLALTSNSGRMTRDEFSVVPDVGITFGWHLRQNWDVYVGYSFIYWSDVVRPGHEVDRTVNPTLVPSSISGGFPSGPARPTFNLTNTDFWAHGINLGMAIRF